MNELLEHLENIEWRLWLLGTLRAGTITLERNGGKFLVKNQIISLLVNEGHWRSYTDGDTTQHRATLNANGYWEIQDRFVASYLLLGSSTPSFTAPYTVYYVRIRVFM